jgi:hypothetical protein
MPSCRSKVVQVRINKGECVVVVSMLAGSATSETRVISNSVCRTDPRPQRQAPKGNNAMTDCALSKGHWFTPRGKKRCRTRRNIISTRQFSCCLQSKRRLDSPCGALFQQHVQAAWMEKSSIVAEDNHTCFLTWVADKFAASYYS